MKQSILALLAVAAAGSAMAETQPYATITNAQGLSTVSVGNKLVNASTGMKLVQGAQILTTAKSAITVDFGGACTATVKAGQSLNVDLAACKSFVASNLNMGSGSAAGGLSESAAALGMSSNAFAAALIAAGVVGVAGVYNITKSDGTTAQVVVTETPTGPTVAVVPPAPVVVPPAPISPA